MRFFLDCPSSCVFPGYFSWEGMCPGFNFFLLFFYLVGSIIVIGSIIRFIKNKCALHAVGETEGKDE